MTVRGIPIILYGDEQYLGRHADNAIPIPPVISRREALVIWMSRIAIKAPRIVPRTAIQVRKLTCSSDDAAIGERERYWLFPLTA